MLVFDAVVGAAFRRPGPAEAGPYVLKK
jgi:hypothetical protein